MNKYDEEIYKIATLFFANSPIQDEQTYLLLCKYVDELWKRQMEGIERSKAEEESNKQIRYLDDFIDEAIEEVREADIVLTEDGCYAFVGLDGNLYSDVDDLITANSENLYLDYLNSGIKEITNKKKVIKVNQV